MNPHPYFREQIAADRRQELTEQANAHRLLAPRGASSKRRRGLARRLWLVRPRQLWAPRAPEHQTTGVAGRATKLPEPAQ